MFTIFIGEYSVEGHSKYMNKFGAKDRHTNVLGVFFPESFTSLYLLHIGENMKLKCGEGNYVLYFSYQFVCFFK